MKRVRKDPILLVAVAIALAASGALLVAAAAGFDQVADRLAEIEPGWLAVVLAGQVIAVGGYVVAYRAVVRLNRGPRLSPWLALRLVAAGFGGFAAGGGFALDHRALREIERDQRAATVRVLGLGAIEYAVIAPAACIASIALLVGGAAIPGGVLWPWALAVPAGFAIALWLAAPKRRERIVGGRTGRGWETADQALVAVGLLREIPARPLEFAPALLGVALYWAGEVVSLWGSLETFDLHLGVGALIVGLATGYAMTRRSMPLAGAGITEALLSFALMWVGLGLASALCGVLAYRLFGFVLPMLVALRARRKVGQLLEPEAEVEVPVEALARGDLHEAPLEAEAGSAEGAGPA